MQGAALRGSLASGTAQGSLRCRRQLLPRISRPGKNSTNCWTCILLRSTVSRISLARLISDFGFFAFIHQLRFRDLVEKDKASKDLILIMIANALR